MKILFTIVAALTFVACKPSAGTTNADQRIKELEAEVAQLKTAQAATPSPKPANPADAKYNGVIVRSGPQNSRDRYTVELVLRDDGWFSYSNKMTDSAFQPKTTHDKYEVDGDRVILDLPIQNEVWTIQGNQLVMADNPANRLTKTQYSLPEIATRVLEDLRTIDSAMDQWGIEHQKPAGTAITPQNCALYLKKGSRLQTSCAAGRCVDIVGNPIYIQSVDTPPSFSRQTYDSLSSVAPIEFWSPFTVK
jgi:hypothetical protein